VKARRPAIGDVIQIALPDDTFAYGRVLHDASVAFYRQRSRQPGAPPVGSRDYEFVVGVYDDVLRSRAVQVVAHDPNHDEEDDWPPPHSIRDRLTGGFRIYQHGEMRPATEKEVKGLEPAAVWDLHHLIARLCTGKDLSHWDAAFR
jgi:hypothetical protein